MLYPNGQRVLTSAHRPIAGALAACGALQYGGIKGARLNRYVSETTNKAVGGVPSGYGLLSTSMPLQAGGVGGRSKLTFAPAGNLVGGVTSTGSAGISFSVADAQAFPLDDTPPARTASATITFSASGTGGLIATAHGSASLTFTVADALLVATVGAAGSASLAIQTNTPVLGALADGAGSALFSITCAPARMFPLNDASPLRTGTASMSFSGSLQPYAVGHMTGSTVDNSVLTSTAIAAAVWDSVAAQFTGSATMGGKLNTASSGGVDLQALVDGVLAALQATAIPVNVKQINNVALTGTGTAGSEWGPA